MGSTGCAHPYFRSDVFVFEVLHQRIDSAELKESAVDQSHPFGFVFDDGNLAVLHLIAEGQGTPDPETLPLGARNCSTGRPQADRYRRQARTHTAKDPGAR